MQDLDTIHLELHLLGFVKTIGQARTMANAFREAFIRQGKHATVFFQHVDD